MFENVAIAQQREVWKNTFGPKDLASIASAMIAWSEISRPSMSLNNQDQVRVASLLKTEIKEAEDEAGHNGNEIKVLEHSKEIGDILWFVSRILLNVVVSGNDKDLAKAFQYINFDFDWATTYQGINGIGDRSSSYEQMQILSNAILETPSKEESLKLVQILFIYAYSILKDLAGAQPDLTPNLLADQLFEKNSSNYPAIFLDGIVKPEDLKFLLKDEVATEKYRLQIESLLAGKIDSFELDDSDKQRQYEHSIFCLKQILRRRIQLEANKLGVANRSLSRADWEPHIGLIRNFWQAEKSKKLLREAVSGIPVQGLKSAN